MSSSSEVQREIGVHTAYRLAAYRMTKRPPSLQNQCRRADSAVAESRRTPLGLSACVNRFYSGASTCGSRECGGRGNSDRNDRGLIAVCLSKESYFNPARARQ